MVRGVVLASLLVQMWPVSVAQARDVARVAEVASTPEAPVVGVPVVQDVTLAATAVTPVVTVSTTADAPLPTDTPAATVTIPPDPIVTVTPEPTPEPPIVLPDVSMNIAVKTGKLADKSRVTLSFSAYGRANDKDPIQNGLVDAQIVLPEEIAYVEGSAKDAIYDPGTRTLTLAQQKLQRKGQIGFDFEADLNVLQTPVNLSVTTTLKSNVSIFNVSSTSLVMIGDERKSDVIKKQDGGKVAVSDRIQIEFDPNALKANTAIETTSYAPVFTPLDETRRNSRLAFSAGPDMSFDGMVTLTVDVNGLVPEGWAEGDELQPTLSHIYAEVITLTQKTAEGQPITNTILKADPVPSTFNAKTGQFKAWLRHFSNYSFSFQKPQAPKVWQLSANGGGVSLFRGSASYAYALQVPPVAGGMQPSIVLNYSSAAHEGNSDDQYVPGQHWSLGRGWSMEVPNITRLAITTFICPTKCQPGTFPGGLSEGWRSGYEGKYPDGDPDYTLTFGGQTYHLLPKGSAGEYVTESFSQIRAVKCTTTGASPCNLTPTNYTGEYWQVWTSDGTRYVFGIDTNSQSYIDGENYDWCGGDGCGSTATGVKLGRVWFLRQAYVAGQTNWSVRYNYNTGIGTISADSQGCGNCSGTRPDPWQSVGNIEYRNPAGTGVPNNTISVAYDSGTTGPKINYFHIKIGTPKDAANPKDYKYYQLEKLGPDGSVSKITEHSWNGTGWVALPATTFSYLTLAANAQGPDKKLLDKISNGYGGEWQYEYDRDAKFDAGVRVKTRFTRSLFPAWTGKETYTYASPCYDSATYNSVAQPCYYVGPRAGRKHEGKLMGYAQSNHFAKDNASNVTQASDEHFFYTDYAKLGREYKTVLKDAAGTAMQASQTTFLTWTAGTHGLPANTWFVAPSQVDSFDFGGVVYTLPYRRIQYAYDDYTNVTSISEYGYNNRTGDERSTHRGYIQNTTNWVIQRVAWENVYVGIVPNGTTANMKTQTYLFYDGGATTADPWTLTPTLGRLTGIKRGGATFGWVIQSAIYDTIGNITSMTDANNKVTTLEYDTSGAYLTKVLQPSVNSVQNYEEYVYNCINEAGTGNCTAPYGALRAMRDKNYETAPNPQTIYEYDPHERLLRVIKPGDSSSLPTVQYAYVDNYTVASAIQGLKVTTQQRETAGGAGVIESYAFYDGLGRALQARSEATSGNQTVTNQEYDALGRAARSYVPAFETSTVDFNRPTSGNIWNTRLSSLTAYDALNRVTSVTAPDGTVSGQGYGNDTISARVRSVDANGHTKVQGTDGLGRMVYVEEYTGIYNGTPPHTIYATTNYEYDALDNLRFVTDTVGNHTDIAYDSLSRKLNMVDPDMGTWNYAYDSNSNLIQQDDANGNRICFYYDSINRLKGKVYQTTATACAIVDPLYAGYAAKYYYDKDENNTLVVNGIGRRVQMVNGVARASWAYDARGRMTADYRTVLGVTGAAGLHTDYQYDSADRVTRIIYPDGSVEVVNIAYDSAGQSLSAVGTDSYASGATYNELGQITRRDGGNLATLYRYWGVNYTDPNTSVPANTAYGSLRGICVTIVTPCNDVGPNSGIPGTSNASNFRMNVAYGYDAVGNITNIGDRTNSNEALQYGYDDLDRLKRYCVNKTTCNDTTGNFDGRYDYNQIGNITAMNSAAIAGSGYDYLLYGACSGYRPHAVRQIYGNGGQLHGFCYDANGNQIWRWRLASTVSNPNDELHRLTWNAENRLVKIEQVSSIDWTTLLGTPVQFAYDAENQRVKSIINGVTTVYIGNHYEKIVAGSGVGQETKYYYFGGQRVAMRNSSGVIWLHSDNLGSTSLATYSGGIAVTNSETRYTPYGAKRTGSTGQPSRYTFTGQYDFTSATGLMDFSARMYDPLIGRFISADTIVPGAGNPQAFNRYSYGFNRPMVLRDPSGHDPRDDSGHSMNDPCNYNGECSQPSQNKKKERQNKNQSACDALGLPGTLCMNHLWNFKPIGVVSIVTNPFSLIAAKSSNEEESEQGAGSNGGGESDKSKNKKGLLQSLVDMVSDAAKRRVTLRETTKAQIQATARKTPNGDFIDPNTGEIIPKKGPFDYGHKPKYEWWRTQEKATAEGWTRKQVIEYENDPTHYQIEDPSSNRGHRFEEP